MDKDSLQRLSKPVADVYLSIEDQLLRNIAKKIARDKDLLIEFEEDGDTQRVESWQLQRLSEIESLKDEQIKTIAKYSGETVEEVEKMLSDAGYKAVDQIEDTLKEGADKGRLLKPPESARESQTLRGVLEAFEDQAKDKLNLTNTTLIDQSEKKYLEVINKTTGNVLAGVSSPQEALRQSMAELANVGVPALVDRAGREWSTEAYVNMVMRSTSNNVANEMQDARMDEYGSDLVEISSHEGARPLCAPYQGRIFSIKGNSDKYPSLDSTSIGEPAGLFGVNCGHVKYPYIEGISKKTFEPVDNKRNEEVYEESQKQRYLERQIRYAKREEMLLKEIGDKEGSEKARRKMLDRQANMRSFIKETDRTRRYAREQI